MLIKHKLDMDLLQQNALPRLSVAQGDANTREVQLSMFLGGVAWPVPADAQVLVRYERNDGSGGSYEDLPDGASAVSVEGNVISIVLVPHVTKRQGFVSLAVSLVQDDKELSTFSVAIDVHKTPNAAVSDSGDYNSVAGMLPAPARAAVGQHFMVTSVSPDGKVTGVTAVDSVDGLMQQADGMVYLSTNGEPFGDGVLLVAGNGSGGGSGGNSFEYTVSLKNLSESRVMTVTENMPVYLSFNYTSVNADGYDDGAGAGSIFVNGSKKGNITVTQGDNKDIDITEYLGVGVNTLKLRVENSEGSYRTLSYTITVAAMRLTSDFDTSVPFTGNIQYIYKPTGMADKTVHILVDGEEIGTTVVSTSGRQQTYEIPAQTHGDHIVECYFEAVVDGETIPSNRLRHAIMCIDGSDTPIIATTFNQTEVEQYDNVVITGRVYDPKSLTTEVKLLANGELVATLTVDRTEQTWTYRADVQGPLTITLAVGDVTKSFELNVNESAIDVHAEVANLALYLSSNGRNNSEANPAVWQYNNVEAQFNNFNFVSDGWLLDNDNNTVLRVTGDARLFVPYNIFENDFRTTGKTIEIEFATRDVSNYDAIVFSCMSDGCGLEISAQRASFKSEQSRIEIPYKEDEHIRLAFVVNKKANHRLVLIYLNGIMSGAMQYPENDDFSQTNPVGISIGSNECTTDLYCIRVYDNDLTRYQVLDNWIADTQVGLLKRERWQRNKIYDEYGQITIDAIDKELPYLILKAPTLPQFKGDDKLCSDSFVNPADTERSYTSEGTEIDVQGTSSQFYYRKNYKLKYKNGFVLRNGNKVTVYAMNDMAVPVAEFTMKADVASSEGYYNVVTAQLFNKYHPFKMPAQEMDPRTRYSIDGFPIVIFWDNGSEVVFLGKYNFNNDKGTAEPFGLVEGDERWEVLQNGTARVGFHSADFSDASWKEDFEGNFPKKNTDLSNLQPMCAWVTSTDTTQATGEAIDPVTYDGVEYNADTAEYRLAKFKAELPERFVEDAVIYYMVFTEAFLCMDQREKNVLWRYIKALELWLADYYDADSIIGHNNQAQPVFDYWMEDIDYTASGDPVFNGQNSTFWKNIRATKPEKLKEEWCRLRDAGLSYESVMAAFEEHKHKWSEAIYNEDMQVKCLDALIDDGNGTYLDFLRGDKWTWTQWWLYNRFRYLDSKYEYGASLENRATIRTNVMVNLRLMYYIKMYGHVYYNAEHVVERVEKDTEYEFASHATGAEDRVIGLNDPDMITSLGDLAPHHVELIDLSKMTRLKVLKLGDASADYVNNALTSVTFDNNTMLRIVDMRNCAKYTQVPNLSKCTNIEEVYLDGTAVTGVSLPNGGILRVLHLPSTVTNLSVRNQTKLQDFVLPNPAGLKALRLENNSDVIDPLLILNAMAANGRVRIVGFDWVMTNSEFEAFINKLDTMRGLDETDGNTDMAQVSGRIYVEEINGATLAKAKKYVGLTVEYGSAYINSIRLVERTLSGDYTNDRVTKLGGYAFAGLKLGRLLLPNVVGQIPERGLASLTADEVELASATTATFFMCEGSTIGILKLPSVMSVSYSQAFFALSIERVVLNSMETMDYSLGYKNGAKTLDFHKLTSLPDVPASDYWVRLSNLIIRTPTVCALQSAPESTTAKLYVPAALVDSYKAATNWSNMADRIFAIEDYPDICEVN